MRRSYMTLFFRSEREMESFEFAFRNGELSIEECSRRLLVNRNPLLVIH